MNPSETMNALLLKHSNRQISLSELCKETAYWLLEAFQTIHVRPLPTMPNRYSEYNRMPDYEKRDMPNAFWHIPEIKNYLDQKFGIINEHKAMLSNLKEMKDYIPEEDFVNRQRYEVKIQEFEVADNFRK